MCTKLNRSIKILPILQFYKHSTEDLKQNTRPLPYHNLCLKHRAYPNSSGAPQILMLQLKKLFCITTLQVTMEKMMKVCKKIHLYSSHTLHLATYTTEKKALDTCSLSIMKIQTEYLYKRFPLKNITNISYDS